MGGLLDILGLCNVLSTMVLASFVLRYDYWLFGVHYGHLMLFPSAH